MLELVLALLLIVAFGYGRSAGWLGQRRPGLLDEALEGEDEITRLDLSAAAPRVDRRPRSGPGISQGSRNRLDFDLTCRILTRHLPESGSVLAAGDESGWYGGFLAQQGYAVTMADAADLNGLETSVFDAVLLMGPMHQLIRDEDRQNAVGQAAKRLKPAGILVSAFRSRHGALGDLLKWTPEWIERPEQVRFFLEYGRQPDEESRSGVRGYFATAWEIPLLHERLGFDTVALAGTEPAIAVDDVYSRLDRRQRELWLELLHRLSGEVSSLGASRQILYIGRKRGA